MEYRALGNTGISVSRLCFGSLTIGPLQANLTIKDGARVLQEAINKGVNFIDTAELYGSYPYINEAIRGKRSSIIVSTKCYAYTAKGAEESLKKALDELGTDYIDFFSLHEQESEFTIKGHYEALEYFIKAKEKGYIRGIGISTHAISAVNASLKYKEIDILHPILNKNGLGIIDGSTSKMLQAIEKANTIGKGIYSMKPLGGGNLIAEREDCLDFVLNNNNLHSIAIGMQSIDEVIYNTSYFNRKEISDKLIKRLRNKKRKLIVDSWCTGCENCVRACGQGGISLKDGKAFVNEEKCVLCGYCSAHCKEFCLKII